MTMTAPLKAANSPVLALDAMGGDHAPTIVIDGAVLARARYPEIKFIFVGGSVRELGLDTDLDPEEARSSVTIVHDTTCRTGRCADSCGHFELFR